MGSWFSQSRSKKPRQYRDYPPGCVPCPRGNTVGNPGTFEELHKKYDNLKPKNFDGVRLLVKKNLSRHFYATHTIGLSSKAAASALKTASEDGYKFKAHYTGTKKVEPGERYPIVYGDIKPNGDLNADFIHTLGCRWRVKLNTQIRGGKYKKLKASTEYRSNDCTFTASLVDPKLLKQEGVLLLQYLQAITSRIAVGAEIACNRREIFPGGQQTNFALAFRYNTGFRTLSATLGQAGVRICYYHIQSRDLQMGVELQSNLLLHESYARILYQVDVPKADVVFRGFVDNQWRIGATFEKKLYPIPEGTMLLSAVLDHNKQNVSVGIGLNVG